MFFVLYESYVFLQLRLLLESSVSTKLCDLENSPPFLTPCFSQMWLQAHCPMVWTEKPPLLEMYTSAAEGSLHSTAAKLPGTGK